MSENSWLKKHVDTAVIIFTIISSILSATIWMNGKFNDIEKDIAIIKTVLVMKKIMPSELAKHQPEEVCEKFSN